MWSFGETSEVLRSPKRSTGTSDFGLFSDLRTRSPPTPFDNPRQKAAARRLRQRKKKKIDDTSNIPMTKTLEGKKLRDILKENVGNTSTCRPIVDGTPDKKSVELCYNETPEKNCSNLISENALCSTKIVPDNHDCSYLDLGLDKELIHDEDFSIRAAPISRCSPGYGEPPEPEKSEDNPVTGGEVSIVRELSEERELTLKERCRTIPVVICLERCDALTRKRKRTSSISDLFDSTFEEPRSAFLIPSNPSRSHNDSIGGTPNRYSTVGSEIENPSRQSSSRRFSLRSSTSSSSEADLELTSTIAPGACNSESLYESRTSVPLDVSSMLRKTFATQEDKRLIRNHPEGGTLKDCSVSMTRVDQNVILRYVVPGEQVDFDFLYNSWDVEIVSKIGEGSFSEVFAVRHIDGSDGNDSLVFKVVPTNGPGQPTYQELLPEVSMCLASLELLNGNTNRAPTFISLSGVHLVGGPYTSEMIEAHEVFRRERPEEAELCPPDERDDGQSYVVFYTSYNGSELERVLPELSANAKACLIVQITFGLAAAEAAFDFEHRDLHLSNVVVSDTEKTFLEFRVDGVPYFVKTCNKAVTLIDYGMSRLHIDETFYTSFSESILQGSGLQGKTYRSQHALLDGAYRNYRPETNGVWLKYLITQLFPRRPVAKKTVYSECINIIWRECGQKNYSARGCVELMKEHIRLDPGTTRR